MKKYAQALIALILLVGCIISLYGFTVYAVPEIKNTEMPVLRAEFTTSYKTSSEGRKYNIAFGASKIDGCIIKSGEIFSFNEIVGPRSINAGFREAKIILDGNFVNGIGGGVCQLSTTVYNAALLSDMEIIEVSSHSLQVAYVKAGFDAMVSSNTDMKFKNTTNKDIVLRVTADGEKLNVKIYGEAQSSQIERISIVIKNINPPPPSYIENIGDYPLGEDGQYILRKQVYGKEVESYISRKFLGITETKKIRHEYYRGLPAIIVISE